MLSVIRSRFEFNVNKFPPICHHALGTLQTFQRWPVEDGWGCSMVQSLLQEMAGVGTNGMLSSLLTGLLDITVTALSFQRADNKLRMAGSAASSLVESLLQEVAGVRTSGLLGSLVTSLLDITVTTLFKLLVISFAKYMFISALSYGKPGPQYEQLGIEYDKYGQVMY